MIVSRRFKPNFILRNSFLQTVFASWKFISKSNLAFQSESVLNVFQTKDKAKIVTYFNSIEKGKPLIVLLHGWEGSSKSSYMIRTGKIFENQGYGIIRINFRDHGNTYHLNEELFHGARYPEIMEVIQLAVAKANPSYFFCLGFSLGGNFCLHFSMLASKKKSNPIFKKLKACFSISPALDPMEATIKMDEHSFFRWYFLKAWKASLIAKEKLFPYLYSFQDFLKSKTVFDLTEQVVTKYSPFKTAENYFDSYTIDRSFFKKLKIPTYILTSEDDPVIPIQEFLNLEPSPLLQIQIERYGGHCGFLYGFDRKSFVTDWVDQIIKDNFPHQKETIGNG